jgi:hypothetical protein
MNQNKNIMWGIKNLTKNPLFYLSLALVVLLGFQAYGLVSAASTYAPPGGNPPTGKNPAQPLDTSSFVQYKEGNLGVGLKGTPNITVDGSAAQRIVFNNSSDDSGKIYYSNGKLYYANRDGVGHEIGSGAITKLIAGTNVTISPATGVGEVTINAVGGGVASVTPPLKLQTASNKTGIIFEKDPNDQSGFNSPSLVFSVYGYNVPQILSSKDGSQSVFSVPVAYALSIPCDGIDLSCISGSGGSGIGTGATVQNLSQPLWWMRQEGTVFYVKASDGYGGNVRPVLTLSSGGGVMAGGPGVQGDGIFFEWNKSANKYVPTAPPGTWCGLDAWEPCNGIYPGSPNHSCPGGYHRRGIKGAIQTQGSEAYVCIKN